MFKKVLGVVGCLIMANGFITIGNTVNMPWSSSKDISSFSDEVLNQHIENPVGEVTDQIMGILSRREFNCAISYIWLIKEKLGTIDTEVDSFCTNKLSELLQEQVNNLTIAIAMWETQHDTNNLQRLKNGFDTDIVLASMRLLYYAKNGCREEAMVFLRDNVIPAMRNSSLSDYIPEGY